MSPTSLGRYAWLSVIAALLTILLKLTAWRLTGSVGLLSDALESVVNLIGGVTALIMMTIASRPADRDHPFGHAKAEYFSSGAEGVLIIFAAVGIAVAAVERLLAPQPLEQPGLGILVSCVATAINFGVGRILLRVGRKYRSIALEADGRHLMTDVWTSAGVVVGVLVVTVTGWQILDPLIAILVAGNISWEGWRILRRTVDGLMDRVLPSADREKIRRILADYENQGIQFHAVRSRQAGSRRFVSMHVLVPGNWTVQRGHQLLEEIEQKLLRTLPQSSIFTHLEPIEDPASWHDIPLDREHAPPPG